jgi:flavorubredoxin
MARYRRTGERGVVQANQYLIVHKGKATLLDPGGVHLFARVVSAVSRFTSLDH